MTKRKRLEGYPAASADISNKQARQNQTSISTTSNITNNNTLIATQSTFSTTFQTSFSTYLTADTYNEATSNRASYAFEAPEDLNIPFFDGTYNSLENLFPSYTSTDNETSFTSPPDDLDFFEKAFTTKKTTDIEAKTPSETNEISCMTPQENLEFFDDTFTISETTINTPTGINFETSQLTSVLPQIDYESSQLVSIALQTTDTTSQNTSTDIQRQVNSIIAQMKSIFPDINNFVLNPTTCTPATMQQHIERLTTQNEQLQACEEQFRILNEQLIEQQRKNTAQIDLLRTLSSALQPPR